MSKRGSLGFTILELLAAMAVFMLFMVILFSVLFQVNLGWQQGQSRIEPRKSGRVILDQIRRELQMAAMPANRAMVYKSGVPSSTQLSYQFLVNPTGLASSILNPQAIFWQAPLEGRMAEVGYFVRWDVTKASNPRAMLCRFFVKQGDANYQILSQPENWLTSSIIDNVAPGTVDSANPANSYKGWFADNVIGLWVRCLDPNGNPIVTDGLGTGYSQYAYDSRRAYRYSPGTSAVIKSGYQDLTGNLNILSNLPDSVEVALVILDNQAAERLSSKPSYGISSPSLESFWKDIDQFVKSLPEPVRKGARVYSARIKLNDA